YVQDCNIIQILGREKNLESLEQVATELETTWFVKNKEYYGYIMLELNNAFSSYNFGNDRQFELARKYSLLALNRLAMLDEEEQIPIEVEIGLIRHTLSLYNFNEAAESNDWPNKRKEIAKLYFRTWERLEKAIDINWDPNDPNLKPLSRPPGIKRWALGMSPEAIEDPSLRAEYEIKFEKYKQRKRHSSRQQSLRKIRKYELVDIQENLLRLYSGPLFNFTELEIEALQEDLERCIEDEEIRSIILNGIQERLLEKSKPKDSTKRRGSSVHGKYNRSR
ncbi:MAG: hypothetical protein ACYTFM_12935, partial [Planctomycetota bacterium]